MVGALCIWRLNFSMDTTGPLDSSTALVAVSPLMRALEAIPQELTRMLLPGGCAFMLRGVAKALKKVVENARLAVPMRLAMPS